MTPDAVKAAMGADGPDLARAIIRDASRAGRHEGGMRNGVGAAPSLATECGANF